MGDLSKMEQMMEIITEFAMTYGLKVLGAILILILGRIIAGVIRKGLVRALTRGKLDNNLARFAGNMAFFAVLAFAIVASLAKFGVETTSFVAILGATGFAIGFALQGSLSNFAAGVMLLMFRPFKTGDFVEVAGIGATVKEIQLFNTMLDTLDNVRIIVPNSNIFGSVIKNYSFNKTRRVDIAFSIGYGEDIGNAYRVIEDEVKKDSRVHDDPAPQIVLTELADSSVNLSARVWVDGPDYWAVHFDLAKLVKERLDSERIEIPFPQQVIHIQKND